VKDRFHLGERQERDSSALASAGASEPFNKVAKFASACRDPRIVRTSASVRLAFAKDASHFSLTPQAVATPTNAADVAAMLRATGAGSVSLTFRSGGTSLSGQAVTDGVLIDTRRYFRHIDVLDDGARVRAQPGATVRQVNAKLAPFGTKLGPDPASEIGCTIGGVIANNSSGMACGTAFNTYRTIESLVLVLPSGTVIDTGAADADRHLRTTEPLLYEGLLRLRDRVRANPTSMRIIAQQFSMKNTMGYGVNSFVDHDEPIEILTHLVVGSEGTLAFVAEAVFRTVPILPHAATGLLVFNNLADATNALPALVGTSPATVELLDATSLRVAQRDARADPVIRQIAVHNHAALLLEYQEADAETLAARCFDTKPLLDSLPIQAPTALTTDKQVRAHLWHMRKGLYAAVAGNRPSGGSALLEDIVVPVASLAHTCEGLGDLFAKHAYRDTVIFGHAKDGNLHFMLTERFDDPALLERYQRFTDDLVDLVLGQNGSMKAEHGTGRMMAPYVRRQYGDELYDVMREIKQLCDPRGILNPGVIIDERPRAHLQHLKTTPTVDTEVDRCVECGYCEPVCPSRDLTTTPRQRIVLRRAMADATASGDLALLHELQADYEYDAVDTCAVDGMCQVACPVNINTGDLVKRLRAENAGRVTAAAWRSAANNWSAVTRGAAIGLNVAATLPSPLTTAATRAARRVGGADTVPLWTPDLPRGGHRRKPIDSLAPVAVYFPSCLNAMFAPACAGPGTGPGVDAAVLALCERAAIDLVSPRGIGGLCCGTPWQSKGLTAGYERMRERTLSALSAATRNGTLPIVCDAASCTQGLIHLTESAGVATSAETSSWKIVDVVEFVAQHVLPSLKVRHKVATLTLHPTCSSVQLGIGDSLLQIAQAVADDVVIPEDWACCGFAGDRGMLHPELTASATRPEAAAVAERNSAAYASCNRTCEIGMSRATGHNYQHIVELLEFATRNPDAE